MVIYGEPRFVQRKTDNKLILVRLNKVMLPTNDGDFDLEWQRLENNIGITDNTIVRCDLYSFYVKNQITKTTQLFLNF